jgi:hypothetical protein
MARRDALFEEAEARANFALFPGIRFPHLKS